MGEVHSGVIHIVESICPQEKCKVTLAAVLYVASKDGMDTMLGRLVV